VSGATYWPYEPSRFVRHWINKSAKEIRVRLGGDSNLWDLGAPEFRKQLIAWKIIDGRDVSVVLETQNLPTVIKEELALLARFGIRIVQLNADQSISGVHAPVQIVDKEEGIVTLLSDSESSFIPGTDWLQAQDASIWVTSESLPAWEMDSINTDDWLGTYATATVLEVTKELNGPIVNLHDHFKALLNDKAAGFMAKLQGSKVVAIRYEDRYLRSPWTVMLLAGFMRVIPSDGVNSVTIETVSAPAGHAGDTLWDNWNNYQDMEEVLEEWVSALMGTRPVINTRDSLAEVSHRRVLTLELESGTQLKVAFDQGMGYWKCTADAYGLKHFDFSQPIMGQVKQMLNSWNGVRLSNGGEWPTDIALYEVKS
jgi:hypothetical protein